MNNPIPLDQIQVELQKSNLDGWLFYDFHRSNDLACTFLKIPEEEVLTRRLFYWIPKKGEPIKIVHAVESHVLKHLLGKEEIYQTFKELEKALSILLQASKTIIMEYSPKAANPYVSKVDGGTIELIKEMDVKVASSADLIQQFTCVCDEDQFKSHVEATDILSQTVDKVWNLITANIENGGITEYDVQQFIMNEFELHDCITDHPPICAVNEHTADPHYTPNKNDATIIKKGDFILIDLWCKKKRKGAIFGDITRVAVAASEPTDRQQEIFTIVKRARDTAIDLIIGRFKQAVPVRGWEVDQACRQVIQDAGYGHNFIHRTGHNIGEKVHGHGVHMDNFEIHDDRLLIPGICFSIEPGIYLPGEFGVRLKNDVFIYHNTQVEVTGGIQDKIKLLS